MVVFALNGEVVRPCGPAITETDQDMIDCFAPASGG
jgi:hypothetical protein